MKESGGDQSSTTTQDASTISIISQRKAKIMSNRKLVGDPGAWKMVGRESNKQVAYTSIQNTNKFPTF